MWVWQVLTIVSGFYLLIGLAVCAIATASGNSTLLGSAIAIYILNMVLYGAVIGKPWK